MRRLDPTLPAKGRESALFRGGVGRTVTACLVVVLFGAGFLVEEHWRGKVALKAYFENKRSLGEKFTLRELLGPDATIEDIAATYPSSTNELGNGPVCSDADPKAHLSDGTALCWKHLKILDDSSRDTLDRFHKRLVGPRKKIAAQYETHGLAPGGISFIGKRRFAQRASSLAISQAYQGDVDRAVDYLGDIRLISKPVDDYQELVRFAIDGAIDGLGASTVNDALASPQWTDESLARVAEAYKPTLKWEAFAKMARIQRALALNLFKYFGVSDYVEIRKKVDEVMTAFGGKPVERGLRGWVIKTVYPAWKFAWLDQGQLAYLQHMDKAISVLAKIPGPGEHIDHNEWQSFMEQIDAPPKTRLPTIVLRLNPVKHLAAFSAIIAPSSSASTSDPPFVMDRLARLTQTVLRNQIRLDLLQAAIGVRRFQLANGKLPGSLEELVPRFLPAIPVDRFSGLPIKYKLEVNSEKPAMNQSWRIYSVGFDGKDNGGVTSDRPEDSKVEDIAIEQPPKNIPVSSLPRR